MALDAMCFIRYDTHKEITKAFRPKGDGWMKKKKVYSIPSIIPGCSEHYDSETGELIGYSTPGLVEGTTEHFSSDGSDAGFSTDGLFGGRDHFDENGSFAGFSTPGILAGADLYDSKGRYAGSSMPNLFAGSTFTGDDTADDAGIFDGDPFDDASSDGMDFFDDGF